MFKKVFLCIFTKLLLKIPAYMLVEYKHTYCVSILKEKNNNLNSS